MASIIPRLCQICEGEWEFFGRSAIRADRTSTVGRKEYEDGAWQRVGDYWKLIGGGYAHLTGKDRGTPWSAAFISWCFSQAGADDRFPYAAAHATYVNAAIRNATRPGPAAPIVGRPVRGTRLKPGDLIGYWRGGVKVTYDNATRIGWYQSHTEILVSVEGNRAFAIGGNVLHSVTKREVKIGAAGDLVDRSENWFVTIENNL